MFQGWVFNVVPWVVSIFSSIFGGWLADFMIRHGMDNLNITHNINPPYILVYKKYLLSPSGSKVRFF